MLIKAFYRLLFRVAVSSGLRAASSRVLIILQAARGMVATIRFSAGTIVRG